MDCRFKLYFKKGHHFYTSTSYISDGRSLPTVELKQSSGMTSHVISSLEGIPLTEALGKYTCIATSGSKSINKTIEVKRVIRPEIVMAEVVLNNTDKVHVNRDLSVLLSIYLFYRPIYSSYHYKMKLTGLMFPSLWRHDFKFHIVTYYYCIAYSPLGTPRATSVSLSEKAE